MVAEGVLEGVPERVAEVVGDGVSLIVAPPSDVDEGAEVAPGCPVHPVSSKDALTRAPSMTFFIFPLSTRLTIKRTVSEDPINWDTLRLIQNGEKA